MTPLRKRMIETLQLRGVSPKTVKIYVDCTARFARYFGKSPEQLGSEDVRNYLLYVVHGDADRPLDRPDTKRGRAGRRGPDRRETKQSEQS